MADPDRRNDRSMRPTDIKRDNFMESQAYGSSGSSNPGSPNSSEKRRTSIGPGQLASQLGALALGDGERSPGQHLRRLSNVVFEQAEAVTDHIEDTRRSHSRRERTGANHPFPKVRQLVLWRPFETYHIFLILSNVCFVAWQAGLSEPSETEQLVDTILAHFFTAGFVIELSLRTMCYGWTFPLKKENWLDSFLVLLGMVVTWILDPIGIEATIIRKLTVLRVLRLARVAKTMRFSPGFQDMWQLIKGLVDSFETLIWTYVLILCVLWFFGIMATALIGQSEAMQVAVINATGVPYSREYFADVQVSMLTLFQIMTLDSWTTIARPLAYLQPVVAAFFVIFISISVFLVMNLITAVIVEQAFASSKKDKSDLAAELELQRQQDITGLRDFFEKIDMDGSGKIDREELAEASRHAGCRMRFKAVGIAPKDLEILWDTLDSGEGCIDVEDFINGISRLKGEAQSKDVMILFRELRTLETRLTDLDTVCDQGDERLHRCEGLIQRSMEDLRVLQRTLHRAKIHAAHVRHTQAFAQGR